MQGTIKVREIRYFYLAPLEFDTVFKTQVIGMVNLFREAGLDYRIIKTYPVKYILNQQKRRQDIKGIRKLYKGPLYILYTFPDRFVAGSILNFLLFAGLSAGIFFFNQNLVIQTRGTGLNFSLTRLKRLINTRVSIIYDARAAGAEEFKYINEPLSPEQQKKFANILLNETRMVQMADKVFAVSNSLIKYLQNQVRELESNKFYVNPCNADSQYFYFDENERLRQRQMLNVANRFVIVYSGGLAMKWHIPQKIFEAFLAIKNEIPDAFFLLLTHDLEQAKKLRSDNHISNYDMLIISADNMDMRPYLNTADAGLLIRDDVPMNNVASPTKFSEYLMCGLPVIISPGVGDYSEIVELKKCGLVYRFDSKNNLRLRLAELNLPFSTDSRMDLSIWAKSNFSKQSNIDKTISLYDTLFNNGISK